MVDTRLRAWTATDQLKDDHRRIWKLFKQVEDLEDTDHDLKVDLLRRLRDELLLHAELEDAVFYPALDGLGLEGVQERVSEAHEEHEIVRLLLEQLSRMAPEDPYFDAKMKVLSDNVRVHVDGEERELFPLFRELDEDGQKQVSEDLRRRKDDLSSRR